MIKGYTYNGQRVTDTSDATFYNVLAGTKPADGLRILHGCQVTVSSGICTISPGFFVFCGRIHEITENETMEVPVDTNKQTDIRIKFVVDMTLPDGEIFDKGYFEIEHKDSSAKFPQLVQNDINKEQSINEQVFASFSIDTDGEAVDGSLDVARTLENATEDEIAILATHLNDAANTEQGAHGFRYFEGKLQVKVGPEWVMVGGSDSQSGPPPGNVSRISVQTGNGKLTIKWQDPGDTIFEGAIASKWKGTKLVYKQGAYPESPFDGNLVVDNRVKNKYLADGITVTGLENLTNYYFALFPYSETDSVNVNVENRFTGKPYPYRIMTVRINLENSNPATCCSYEDDAIGMVPGSDAWDDFFKHYPCLLKLDGSENGKLRRDDRGLFEDGTAADITTGNAGNVMICYPIHGVNLELGWNTVTGGYMKVSMTDNPEDSNFKYYAHTDGTTKRDKFYLGAYEGYIASETSKMQSLSNILIQGTRPNTEIIDAAKLNGNRYDILGIYQLGFIQTMYILKYANINAASVIGRGRIDLDSNGTYSIKTGLTNKNGMDWGTNTYLDPMILFGLENLWGNCVCIVGRVAFKTYIRLSPSPSRFINEVYTTTYRNDDKSMYKLQSQSEFEPVVSSSVLQEPYGFMSKPVGTAESGFIAKEFNGSSGATFSAYSRFTRTNGSLSTACCIPGVGTWNRNTSVSLFSMKSTTDTTIGARAVTSRLMYL